MSKHTPGPWRVEPRCHTPYVDDLLIVDAAGNWVALADSADKANNADRADADARLIAAAPDMAEALRDVHRCMLLPDKHGKITLHDHVQTAVRAALAKAGV